MNATFTESHAVNLEKVSSLAQNLHIEFPRSPRDTSVGGYLMLARAVDKLRGILTDQDGTQNIYGSYHYNCPLDKMLFGHFGIDADALKAVISGGATDDEIGAWFSKQVNVGSMEAKVAFNNEWRYKNIADLPLGLQMYLEGAIAKQMTPQQAIHVRYFLDVIDTKEGRL